MPPAAVITPSPANEPVVRKTLPPAAPAPPDVPSAAIRPARRVVPLIVSITAPPPLPGLAVFSLPPPLPRFTGASTAPYVVRGAWWAL